MQIRNPYVGTEPLKCLAVTLAGDKYPLSMISTPLLTVNDDVSELIVEWPWQGQVQSKVWTQAKGWLEVCEYHERKAFEAERAELAEARKRQVKKQPHSKVPDETNQTP